MKGLPSAEYCADLLHLSSCYFDDLLKQETGKNAQEYVQFKRFDIAKKRLASTNNSISQIAKELRYPFGGLIMTNRPLLREKIVGIWINSTTFGAEYEAEEESISICHAGCQYCGAVVGSYAASSPSEWSALL